MEYVALAWRPSDEDAAALAAELGARLDRDGRWRAGGRTGAAALWLGGGRPVARVLPRGGGFLLGEAHRPVGDPELCGAWLDRMLDADPEAACRRLTGGAWGRYVALFLEAEAPWRAYREPSGALEAYVWRRGRVLVAASGVQDLPAGMLPDRIAMDWDSIARLLRMPSRAALEVPLEGIRALRPGVLEDLEAAEGGTTLWSPAMFVGRSAPDPTEARRELVRRVDGAVGALASGHERLLVEISGGLDSAIVGTSLAAQGLGGRACAWVNYFDGRRAGDERPYSRTVAERSGAGLCEAPLRAEPLDEASFADLARSVRPPMTGTGRFYDDDLAARARGAGATAILGGQGGDAAFFQMPTPWLLADAVQLEGRRALWSGIVGDLARWTRSSAWSVVRQGLRRPAELRLPDPVPGLRAGIEGRMHPWVLEAPEDLPAKRLQVAALGQAWLYAEDSARRRAAEVLNPLFAQPVMELVLAIPAPMLAEGGRDRALAREAFAHRLPAEVAGRKSKGGLDGYYGDVALASLDWLRPHLLDGCLCDAGLIDRDVLAAALTPEHIVWRGKAVALMGAALVESWVRWWQARAPDSRLAPRTA